MTARRRAAFLIAAIASATALVVIAVVAPRVAAAGWLIGFIFVSAIPLGSLALLLIHGLTGGHWGDSLRPVLVPAAACIPLLALAFVPVLIAVPSLFSWAAHASAVRPDVAHLYLNMPLFILRAVIAFIGWSILAIAMTRPVRAGTLWAAFGLLFYSVAISVTSVDWVISSEPGFVSTSFGAAFAVMQLLAALAFATMWGPPTLDVNARRDLGGLMLAVALGLTYIDFMALLVIWYGDLPDKVDWFVERTLLPWRWLAAGAFVLGSAAPILLLFLARVRANLTALRVAAASFLCGIALYDAYLLAPVYGPWSLLTAVLAVIAMGGLLIACIGANWPATLFARWMPYEAAHG
jgi:hypothetical protein